MTRTLTHRSNVPFMVIIPDDPDALKLIRLLLAVFNFAWRNRAEILLLVENVNKVFDVASTTLEFCGECYDLWMVVVCRVKFGFATEILSSF